ncbi:MAG: GAF domain-containing protein [bacterium]|nr:GAF domain-containing protein [bacterium]
MYSLLGISESLVAATSAQTAPLVLAGVGVVGFALGVLLWLQRRRRMAQARVMERILDGAARLTATRRLPEMCDSIVGMVGEIFGFERVVLYLWSDALEVFEARSSLGFEAADGTQVRERTVSRKDYDALLLAGGDHGPGQLVPEGVDGDDLWSGSASLIEELVSPDGEPRGYVRVAPVARGLGDAADDRHLLTYMLQQVAAAVDAAEVYERLANRNADLSLASEKLASLADMKANFVANVSHELRTPLTSISAYTELLQQNLTVLPPESLDEFLAVIHTESLKLTDVINDILELSRMENGRPVSARAETDLEQLVRRLEDGWKGRAADSEQNIEVVTPDHAINLHVDPVLIQQLLTHLVANALKFTPEGGRVSIHLSETGTAVRLAVEDTGIGIPEDELGAIFEKFYQVDGSATREHNGQGVGLAICHEIVTHHDGRIWAENREGGGARFQVLLPRRPAVVQPSGDPQSVLAPFEPGEFHQRMLHWISGSLGVQTVSLLQPDEHGESLEIRASIGLPESVAQGVRVRFGSGIAGRVWATGETLLIADVTRDRRVDREVSEPRYSTPSLLCVPLHVGGDVHGVLSVNNRIDGRPLDADDRLLLEALAPRVTELMTQYASWQADGRVLSELRESLRATTSVGHLRQESFVEICREICLAAARRLELSTTELGQLAFALRYYDVGMGCVPPQLLDKPEPLAHHEQLFVQRHVEAGLSILEPLRPSARARQIILHHHENWDGTGYPRGLTGDAIPAEARLLRLTDTFAALLSPRPWRSAFGLEEALTEIRQGVGRSFCPRTTSAFLAEAESRRYRIIEMQTRGADARDLARPALDRRGMVTPV